MGVEIHMKFLLLALTLAFAVASAEFS